jgi:hypothetical protein
MDPKNWKEQRWWKNVDGVYYFDGEKSKADFIFRRVYRKGFTDRQTYQYTSRNFRDTKKDGSMPPLIEKEGYEPLYDKELIAKADYNRVNKIDIYAPETKSADAKEVKATETEPKMSQLLYTDFKMGTETYFDIWELQGENLVEVARLGQETDAANENFVPNKWVLSPVERKTVRKYEDGGYITKGGPKTAPKLIKAGPLSMINTPPNLTQALVAGLKKLGYKDDIKFFHGESKKTAFGELTPIEKRKAPTPDEKSKTLAEKEKKSKKEVDIFDALAKDERVSKLADKLDDMKEKLFKGGMTREQATKLQADIDDTQKQLEKMRKKVKAELKAAT